ncbi:DNA topoisomerase VI subunit B, partial [Candidatus Woesearchaeota archaeon CG10_big_fil_rev_8_21_14_0_10_30_7]
NDNIKIMPIGELVDKYTKNKEVFDASHLNIQVPSFNPKTYKYSFQKVSHLIKHERNNEIYEIFLEAGRKIKVTGCHSVFGVSNLKIKEIEARNLNEGDHLCVPSKIPSDDEKKEINILDYINEDLVKKNYWYIYNVPVELIKNVFSKAEIIHKKTDKSRKYYRFTSGNKKIDVLEDSYKYNYLKKGFLPLYLYKKLNLKIPEVKIRTYYHGKEYNLPITWPITKSLMRFIGFYVAEGHCDNRQIGFTFSETEKEFVKEVTDFALSYGLNYTIERRPEKSCVRIKLFGGILSNFVKCLCGKGAKNKQIPDFVFTASLENRQHFLDAYYNGDGHRFKKANQLTASTVSKKLANQLVYLWLMQGVIASIRENETKGLGKLFSKNYMIDVYGNSINKSFDFRAETKRNSKFINIPKKFFSKHNDASKRLNKNNILKSLGFGSKPEQTKVYVDLLKFFEQNKSFNEKDIIKICSNKHPIAFLEKKGIIKTENGLYLMTDAYTELSENLAKIEKLANSDFAFLKIKKIRKITEGYKYVYDLSVPGSENFVGGLGGVSCHNSRGQQGIGISAALLYAQLTTGRPAKITSKTGKNKEANCMEIRINTQQNAPEVLNEKIVEYAQEHGTRIELDVEATYQKGGQSIDAYVKQTAIVNPHATIIYTTPKAEQFIFARITNDLPIEPKEIKPHPYGVEHGILTKMLKSTESRTVQSFLTTDFSRVGAGTAKEICSKAGLLTNMKPSDLTHAHVDKLIQGIKETSIISPSTDCLSPIGEELMEKGLRKEINAEFYTAVSRKPSVYKGIPFVIEVSIAYGGDQPSEGAINLLRYANKVPLLYQQGAGAIFKSVIGTAWRSYGLQQSSGALPQGPVTLAVHLASVWPPFTSESKESLASYPEIIKEIKLALQDCGRKLGSYVNKKRKIYAEQKKRGFIEKYIPHVCEALADLLKLTKKDQEKIGENLKQILEKHRGQLKKIEIDNPEYDEELANIGKEEQKELDDYE